MENPKIDSVRIGYQKLKNGLKRNWIFGAGIR